MHAVPVSAPAPVLAPPRAALRRMPDERLARWAARGSEAAFTAIFERHHQALHRYCHSIVGNGHDASDALQSTMLKAFRALSGETREITLRPWLYRIAHNESISLLRARRSDTDLEAAAHVGDPAAEGLVESRDRLRSLASDLTELTEQGRGALLMRELGGLGFAEIADALAISPAAAKQSVYESRCVLQALQEGRDMDCDVVRRTLSDGDRRMLRGKRLRGHLRSCASCHDFERALRERPTHLAALAPPLPLAAAAAMLHGLIGGGGGFSAGGGLLAGLTGGAKGVLGVSLATKVATVAVVGTTIVGGGALVVAPERGADARPAPQTRAAAAGPAAGASAATVRVSPAHATTLAGGAALAGEAAAGAGAGAGATGNGPLGADAGAPAVTGASQAARGGSKNGGGNPAPGASSRSGKTGAHGRPAAGAKANANANANARANANANANANATPNAAATAKPTATPKAQAQVKGDPQVVQPSPPGAGSGPSASPPASRRPAGAPGAPR